MTLKVPKRRESLIKIFQLFVQDSTNNSNYYSNKVAKRQTEQTKYDQVLSFRVPQTIGVETNMCIFLTSFQ